MSLTVEAWLQRSKFVSSSIWRSIYAHVGVQSKSSDFTKQFSFQIPCFRAHQDSDEEVIF